MQCAPLILLELPSHNKHPLPIICRRHLGQALDALEALQRAPLCEDDEDLEPVADLDMPLRRARERVDDDCEHAGEGQVRGVRGAGGCELVLVVYLGERRQSG